MARLWFFAITFTLCAVALVSLSLLGLFVDHTYTVRVLLFLPLTPLAVIRSVQLLRAIQRKDTTWRPPGSAQPLSAAAWALVTFGTCGLIISVLDNPTGEHLWPIIFGAVALVGVGLLVASAVRKRRNRRSAAHDNHTPSE